MPTPSPPSLTTTATWTPGWTGPLKDQASHGGHYPGKLHGQGPEITLAGLPYSGMCVYSNSMQPRSFRVEEKKQTILLSLSIGFLCWNLGLIWLGRQPKVGSCPTAVAIAAEVGAASVPCTSHRPRSSGSPAARCFLLRSFLLFICLPTPSHQHLPPFSLLLYEIIALLLCVEFEKENKSRK